jgi:hypothetical protein
MPTKSHIFGIKHFLSVCEAKGYIIFKEILYSLVISLITKAHVQRSLFQVSIQYHYIVLMMTGAETQGGI